MDTPALIGLSKQVLMKQQLSVIANNIANVSTVGFKGEQMLFAEYLSKAGQNEKISFVQGAGIVSNYAMGQLIDTTNSLDMAIEGRGYFAVETPLGTRYTRNGHFQLNELRQIVTSDGYPLLSSSNRPIVLGPNDREITIAHTGEISTESGLIGKVQTFQFDDENQLRRTENGLFSAPLQPKPADQTKILQGKLEQSNVEPISEVTKMIEIARAYESANKLIESENDRKRRAIQTLTQTN